MRLRLKEALGYNDRGSRSIACRAALKFGEGEVNHGGFLDLVQRVLLLKLRVWVACRMLVADTANLCEVVFLGSISAIDVSKVVTL